MRFVERSVGIVANTGAGYLVVNYGAQAASHAADFASYVGPKIASVFSLLSNLGSQNNQSLITISISWPKVFSNFGTKMVDYGHNFGAFSNVTPLYGAVAGFGISTLACATDFVLERTKLKNWSFTRLMLSHALAGAAVWGLSLTAMKVSLLAVALTVPAVITLTATVLTVNLITKLIFHCITKKVEPEKPKPDPMDERPTGRTPTKGPTDEELIRKLDHIDDKEFRSRFVPPRR